MGTDQPEREQGIDFGSLEAELRNLQYPVEKEELLGLHGSKTLDLVDGQTTLGEVLNRDDKEAYEDEEMVRQSIFGLVGDGAVGREQYTDRGGTSKAPDDSDEPESI